MTSQWYYASGGKTFGPISAEELQELARSGGLSASDLVWREGMTDWVSAASIGLGLSVTAAPPPVPNPNFPPSPGASSPGGQGFDASVGTSSVRRSSNKANTQWFVLCGAILLAIVGLGGFLLGRGEHTVLVESKEAASSDRKPEGRSATSKPKPEEKTKRTEPRLEEQQPESVVATNTPADPFTEPAKPSLEPAAPKDPLPTLPSPDADKSRDPAVPLTTSPPRPEPELPSPSSPQPTQTDKPKSDAHRTLYQQVEILRRPRFSIQGLETAQEIRYQLSSRLDIELRPDGRRKVVQYVQDTQLLQADDLSRDTFAKSLERLKNQQYTYTLNASGEVIEFTGHKDNVESISVALPATQGFAVTSVIDKDGWKELAELTFLTPDPKASANKPWQRQMTHDWGSLGTWTGMTTFKRKGTTKGIQEIEYAHNMKYTKADSKESGLPIKITNANFEPQKAGGRLEFDVQKQQVRLAQEVFEVRGILTAELLGQSIEIQLFEQQLIQIRIGEQPFSLPKQ